MGRKEICMLEDDIEYLNGAFPEWESLKDGSWVLLPDFPIPEGYTVKEATVAIQLPGNYPTTAPDMAYFFPFIERSDGLAIPATQVSMNIDGKSFQRWSRHYKPGTWHPDEDGLAIHVMAIKDWLERSAS
ncbi:MAG: E2/UBC family protein [Anaerotignum sp.]|nr:E2/UBC family protein [Anaerotignum sp.]